MAQKFNTSLTREQAKIYVIVSVSLHHVCTLWHLACYLLSWLQHDMCYTVLTVWYQLANTLQVVHPLQTCQYILY